MALSTAIINLFARRGVSLPQDLPCLTWLQDDSALGFTIPFIWYSFVDSGKIPPTLAARGEGLYWANYARFILLRERLKDILVEFAKDGLQVILLKGVLFGENLYPSPGLRMMNDLDLLVHPADFLRAVQKLQTLGWQLGEAVEKELTSEWTGDQQTDWDWRKGEVAFEDCEGGNLDLHWHLIPFIWWRQPYHVNLAEIWEQAVPLQAPDLQGAFSLSLEHTLAYLCLHLALHGLSPARRLLDIDQFIRIYQGNLNWSWDEFLRCSQRWGIRSAAYHTLLFCKYLYNTPFPDHILNYLNPGWLARVRLKLFNQPKNLLYPGKSTLGVKYPTLIKLVLADQLMDILRMVVKVIFPDKAWRLRHYETASLSQHWKHVLRVLVRGD